MFVQITYSYYCFNDTATTDIYTLSLHDALPISRADGRRPVSGPGPQPTASPRRRPRARTRSEEHTSELQSQSNFVCRLLLEKKNRRVGEVRPAALEVCRRLAVRDHDDLTRALLVFR